MASFWLGRGLSWASKLLQPFNFFLLMYMTLNQQPLAWLMFPIGFGMIVAFLKFDNAYVFSPESNYSFDKSPRMVEMRADILEMKEMLKKVSKDES